jgi:cyclopropane-fatty-acyl-phospholipid synthase
MHTQTYPGFTERESRGFSIARMLIRRIVASVADRGKCHLKVFFSDDSTYHSTRLGEPDATNQRELANEPSAHDRFASIGVYEHAGRDCNERWLRSIAIGLRSGGIGLIAATFNMNNAADELLHDQAHRSRRLHPQPCRDAAIHGEAWPRRRGHRQPVLSLPSHRRAVAGEPGDPVGGNSYIGPVRFDENFRRTWLYYVAGVTETFEAAREIINCCHIEFVKGHCARMSRPAPIDRSR